jgi:transcriptional regulator with XRE-family HTH domain
MPGPGNVGERVRDLRLTRRLSQAQLAGHDLSDSYISLIESGKRTPTPAVLRLLAERLDCTPEYLSDGVEPEQRAHLEVRERQASLALLRGEPRAALAGFDDVIERSDDPELTTRTRWGRACALEDLGRIEAAIGVLESLREQAEREPARSSWLPPVISLARCYHTAGDLGQAISLGERALNRLHGFGLTIGQECAEVGRVLLLAYVDRADPERAHELGRGLLSTEDMDGVPLVDAYQRASSRALEEGLVGDALYLADQALSTQALDVRLRADARLQMAGARALLRSTAPYDLGGVGGINGINGVGGGISADDRSSAQEALDLLRACAPALAGTDAAECAVETARALVLLGEFQQAVDTAERALTDLGAVLPRSTGPDRSSGATGEPATQIRTLEIVRARLVLARAWLAQGDRSTTATMLASAARELQGIRPGRPTAHAFRELGDLCDAVGDNAGATAAYRRALESAGLRAVAVDQAASRDVVGL